MAKGFPKIKLSSLISAWEAIEFNLMGITGLFGEKVEATTLLDDVGAVIFSYIDGKTMDYSITDDLDKYKQRWMEYLKNNYEFILVTKKLRPVIPQGKKACKREQRTPREVAVYEDVIEDNDQDADESDSE